MTPFTRPEDEFAAAGLSWLLETFVTPFVGLKLVRCLDLAYVNDRQAILNSLLPPRA
jgi:hypothetical protein